MPLLWSWMIILTSSVTWMIMQLFMCTHMVFQMRIPMGSVVEWNYNKSLVSSVTLFVDIVFINFSGAIMSYVVALQVPPYRVVYLMAVWTRV